VEDVFDKIEKVYKGGYVFLVLGKGNKRKSLTKPSSYYFSYIDYKDESLIWEEGLNNGACLIPGEAEYNRVKKLARENMVRCLFVILSEEEYYYLTHDDYYSTKKSDKKKTWWNKIREWYERYV
jgi:hypothetical protein